MSERFSVHQAESGDWFYSLIDETGLLNVGYWKSEEEATAAAKAELDRRDGR